MVVLELKPLMGETISSHAHKTWSFGTFQNFQRAPILFVWDSPHSHRPHLGGPSSYLCACQGSL